MRDRCYSPCMDTYLWSLGAAALVALVSLSGVMFSAGLLGRLMQRNLKYLATFSGGVFAIVVYHLLEESLHESDSFALVAGSVLFGAALMQALHHLIPDGHHHHETAHDHTHSTIDGRRVIITDAIHNVGDGILLVASYAVSVPIGIAATIGIVIHESVQEISEYFVLREAGYTAYQAAVRNLASASTIFVGVGIAAFLSSSHEIAVLFAGVAAGGFLAILLQDLIPHAIRSARAQGSPFKHCAAAVLGVGVMLAVQLSLPHEEAEEGLASTGAAMVSVPR